MKIGTCVTITCLLSGLLFSGSLQGSAWGADLQERDAIRQEIKQMRQDYETRMSAGVASGCT